MGMSRRQYAAHRGVSHTAVGKAISSGRISLEPDGSIDPVTADRQWDAQTDRLRWSPELNLVYGVAHAPKNQAEFLDLLHPDDRTRVASEFDGFLGSPRSNYSHRFRITRPDGERVILDRGTIVRDETGLARYIREAV